MYSDEPSRPAVILIIDDDTVITELIKTILSKDGYEVHVAHDGMLGVQTAEEKKPDLVLMDITMPRLSGYEATERIKQSPALRDVPVIFLTGQSATEEGGKAFSFGGAALLRKPFTNQQLRDLVKLALMSVKLK